VTKPYGPRMNPLPIERTDSHQPPGRMNREVEINNDVSHAMSRRRPTKSTCEQGATATIHVAPMIAATSRFKPSQTALFVGEATGNHRLA
jgi:hypothetical protein